MQLGYPDCQQESLVSAEKLQGWMKSSGVTQGQLAEMTGVKQHTISRYANGKSKIPNTFALLMAGIVTDPKEREYWISIGGSEERRGAVERALQIKPPPPSPADRASGMELARAIELLTKSWRAGGQNWQFIVETLGDKAKARGDIHAKAHGKGRKDRPGESKAS